MNNVCVPFVQKLCVQAGDVTQTIFQGGFALNLVVRIFIQF